MTEKEKTTTGNGRESPEQEEIDIEKSDGLGSEDEKQEEELDFFPPEGKEGRKIGSKILFMAFLVFGLAAFTIGAVTKPYLDQLWQKYYTPKNSTDKEPMGSSDRYFSKKSVQELYDNISRFISALEAQRKILKDHKVHSENGLQVMILEGKGEGSANCISYRNEIKQYKAALEDAEKKLKELKQSREYLMVALNQLQTEDIISASKGSLAKKTFYEVKAKYELFIKSNGINWDLVKKE